MLVFKKVLYLNSTFNNLLINFRDERDWKQFHNSKDLALAISIEAAELNELFLWKSNEDVDKTNVKDCHDQRSRNDLTTNRLLRYARNDVS